MKSFKYTLCCCAALALVSTAHAQVSEETLKSIQTPDKVKTSIGTLKFIDGAPLPETSKKVYDYLDTMRGVDAFLKGVPGASVNAIIDGLASMEIDKWILMVEALNNVSDGHDGFVLTLTGGYTWQVNDSWTLSLGASTSYADDDYMSSFFDVDVRDSQRSGLNIYDADSGFKDVGCTLLLFISGQTSGAYGHRGASHDSSTTPRTARL